MGRYRPLFSVEVEHTYFDGGLCQSVSFRPESGTKHKIEQSGLLIKQTSGGVRVYYDDGEIERVCAAFEEPDPIPALTFTVVSDDSLFQNYTASSPGVGDDAPLLDARNAFKEDDGRYRLHAGDTLSDGILPTSGGDDGEPEAHVSNRLMSVTGTVRIPMDNVGVLTDPQEEARRYYLRYEARRTLWQYYLIGELAFDPTTVQISNKTVDFDFVGRRKLGKKIASVFRSRTPIPLKERSNQRFQLKEGNSGNGRVLMDWLPVADAGQINREIVDGEEAIVSDVFVNC